MLCLSLLFYLTNYRKQFWNNQFFWKKAKNKDNIKVINRKYPSVDICHQFFSKNKNKINPIT